MEVPFKNLSAILKRQTQFLPPLNRNVSTFDKIKSKTHPRCGFDLYTWTRDQPHPGYLLEEGIERTLGTRLIREKQTVQTLLINDG